MNRLAKLASKKTLRVAGLISWTSADGIDVAIVDIGPRGVKLKAFATVSYSSKLRREVMKLCDPETARIDDLCRLNFALGEAFASALIAVAKRRRCSMSKPGSGYPSPLSLEKSTFGAVLASSEISKYSAFSTPAKLAYSRPSSLRVKVFSTFTLSL